eukprot:18243-Heterococcus_DN1.PRE.1
MVYQQLTSHSLRKGSSTRVKKKPRAKTPKPISCTRKIHRKKSSCAPCPEPSALLIQAAQVTGLEMGDSSPSLSREVVRSLCSAIRHLSEHALDVEGLYRISGLSTDVDALTSVLSTGEVTNSDLQAASPHSIAGAVKAVLRNHAPIIPYRLWARFNAPGADVGLLRAKLPALNKALLATVLEHASEIVDRSASNKMGVDALARTLGSNISRSSEIDGVAEMLLSHKLFAALLTSWRSASAQSPPKSDAPKVDSPVLTAPLLPARLSSAQAMTLIQHTEPAAALLSGELAAPSLTIDTAAAPLAAPVVAAAAAAVPVAAAVPSPKAGGSRAQPVSVGDRVRAPLIPADRSNSSRHAEGTVTRMRLDGSCDVVFNSGAIALGVPRESVLILQSAAAAAAGGKSQSPKSKSPRLGSTLRDVVHKLSDPVGLLFNSTTADSTTVNATSQPGLPRSSSPSRLAATVSLTSAFAKAQPPTDLSTTLSSSTRLSRPLSLPHSRSKETTAAATAEEQSAGRAKAVSLSPSSRLSLPSPRSTAHAHNANSSSTGSTTVSSVLSKLQAAATSPRSALRQTAQLHGGSEEPHSSTGGYTSTAYATSSGTVDAMTAVVRQTLLDRAAQQTLHYSTVKYKSAYAAAANSGDVPAVESDYYDADFAATGLSRSPSRSPARSAATGAAATGTTVAAAAATATSGFADGSKSLPHSGGASGSKRSPTAVARATATGTTASSKPDFMRVSAADDQYISAVAAAGKSSESGSTAAAGILAQAQASMAAERVQLHRQIYSLQADVSAEAAARAVSESALAAVQAQAAAAAALAQQQQHELQRKLAAAEAQLAAVTRRNERSDAVDRETQSVLLVQDRLIKSLQAEVDITNRAKESAVQEANKLLYTQHYSHTAASIVDVDSAILWRERALRYEEQLSRLGITLAPHITTAAAASSSSGTGSSSAVKATNTLTSADFSASRKATAAAAAAAAVGGSVTKQHSSSAAHRDVVVASLACFEHSMLVQQGVSQRLEQQLSRAKQALAAAQAAAAAAQTSGGTVHSSSSTTSAAAATDTVLGAATDAVLEETVVQPDTTAATAAASETASARVQATLIANATAQAQRKAALQQRTGGSPHAITDTGNSSSSSAGPRCEFSTAYASAAHSFKTPNKAQLQRHQPHGSSGSGTAGA